jgi:uncharacterized protein (DUF2141 family)
MKNIFFLFCFAMLAFHPIPEGSGGKLTIRFEGIGQAGGTVRLALYSDKAAFMVEEKAVLHNFKVDKSGTVEGTIENLQVGSHAFAVFLDENNNKELDKNLVGVPTEPYGFSKVPPSKWRLPSWDEVKFEVGQSNPVMVVKLKRWALL